MAQANIKAVITAEDKASSTIAGFGHSFTGLAAAMAVGQIAAQAFTKAVDMVVEVTKNSVGAAYEQVRQVQNATFALRAYEHDAGKVNDVLKQLVAFARSDMGVLFQREDLFKAASNLRAFGVASDEITDKVKILARGVSLGMTTFDELSQIIGRVVQKGRLDADEFDMLAQRGIVLSTSFRGAKVSSEQLFNELSRVLPEDLLKGRAATIDGLMIRLQSGFRDLGSAILGVDADTSQFIKGGLGDMFLGWVSSLTDFMKKPEVKQWFKDLGEGISNTLKWVWENVLKPFGKWWEENWPKIWQLIQQAWAVIKPIWDEFVRTLKEDLWPEVVKLYNELKPYIPLLGVVLVAAVAEFVVGLLILAKVINGVVWYVNFAIDQINAMKATAENVGHFIGGVFNWLSDRVNDFKWAVIDARNALDRLVGGGNQMLSGIRAGAEHRAMGGSVTAGRAYIVGENGPELYVPSSSGSIVPNKDLNPTSSSSTTININVGLMTGSAIERREAAMKLFEDLKDIASQKGQSVAQLVGSA